MRHSCGIFGNPGMIREIGFIIAEEIARFCSSPRRVFPFCLCGEAIGGTFVYFIQFVYEFLRIVTGDGINWIVFAPVFAGIASHHFFPLILGDFMDAYIKRRTNGDLMGWMLVALAF